MICICPWLGSMPKLAVIRDIFSEFSRCPQCLKSQNMRGELLGLGLCRILLPIFVFTFFFKRLNHLRIHLHMSASLDVLRMAVPSTNDHDFAGTRCFFFRVGIDTIKWWTSCTHDEGFDGAPTKRVLCLENWYHHHLWTSSWEHRSGTFSTLIAALWQLAAFSAALVHLA